MAAVTHGLAFVYGVDGTITGAAIESDDEDQSFDIDVSVEKEDGVKVTRRLDDVKTTKTLQFFTGTSYTYPAMGSVLTYMTVKYIVLKISNAKKNKDFKRCTLSLENHSGITLA